MNTRWQRHGTLAAVGALTGAVIYIMATQAQAQSPTTAMPASPLKAIPTITFTTTAPPTPTPTVTQSNVVGVMVDSNQRNNNTNSASNVIDWHALLGIRDS